MKKKFIHTCIGLGVFVFVLWAVLSMAAAQTGFENAVDIELILAVDVSQSMDDVEQQVQKEAYAEALVSPRFLSVVQEGDYQRISIMYVEWGDVHVQNVVVDWTIIDGLQSAQAVANKIINSPVIKTQRTSISAMIKFGVDKIENGKYQGVRKVIDVSGDGPNNQGIPMDDIREWLKSTHPDITINGLPLMMPNRGQAWQAMQNLDKYYEDCVIAGPNRFVMAVTDIGKFKQAVEEKLLNEMVGLVPKKKEDPFPVIKAQFNFGNERQKVICNMFD